MCSEIPFCHKIPQNAAKHRKQYVSSIEQYTAFKRPLIINSLQTLKILKAIYQQ